MGSCPSSESHTRTTSTCSDIGSADFGYEEFGGRDGKTCPTCHGTGRISKRQSEELVALIPYSDKRLKPRRTCMYVGIAVFVSLIVCGLILFFILPRSVKITEGGIQNYTVKMDTNTSSTVIVVTNQFNVTNTNFFQIKVTKLDVETLFDQVQVGKGSLKGTPLIVPAKTSGFLFNVTVTMTFDEGNNLRYVINLCKNKARGAHDLLIIFQATLTSEYMSHSEQGTTTGYKYLDCSVPVKHVRPAA